MIGTQRQPELLGQTVVVIGGTSGIGLETARRARVEGAIVILTGRNPARLKQAALELDTERTAAFDANDSASLQSFFEALSGPIDHAAADGRPLLHLKEETVGRRGGRRCVFPGDRQWDVTRAQGRYPEVAHLPRVR